MNWAIVSRPRRTGRTRSWCSHHRRRRQTSNPSTPNLRHHDPAKRIHVTRYTYVESDHKSRGTCRLLRCVLDEERVDGKLVPKISIVYTETRDESTIYGFRAWKGETKMIKVNKPKLSDKKTVCGTRAAVTINPCMLYHKI